MKALIRNITVVCAIGFAFLIMWVLPKSVHAAGTTTTYTFNVNMLSSDSDKERIVEGAEFDRFIKTYGSVIKRWSSQYGVSSTEVGKAGTGGFIFTISGEADVKIVTSSTGESNESAVALVDEKGNKKTNKQGISVVAGTGKTELTYKGLAKGTYKFISPEDPYRGRGARVYEIKITETIGSTCWESIEKPSLVSVNVNGADIIIRYRMLIGYNGADQVILSLYNAETGDELETKTFEEEGGEGTAVFTPTVSGKYFCSIRAVRENEEDKVGINSATIDYSKRLTAPLTYVEPEYRVISDTLATTSKYKLELFSNADGTVSVIDMDGEIIAENLAIIAGEKLTIPITLPELENSFKIMMVPNKDFKPLGEGSLLTTYEAREIIFKVTRKGTVVGDGVTAIYNHDNFEIVFYSDGGTLWNDWREKSGLAVSKSIRVADKGKVYLPEDSSRLFAGGYEKIDLKGFDTSHAVDMSYMFASCSVETLDLSQWNFSNVTNVAHMFSNCRELTELNMCNCDLSSVTNMENMLEHCVSLRTLNMKGINLSNVTNIKSVFRENCLAHIDLSNANLSSVENISSLFYDSYNLISVDLSGADMSSVKNMRYMFAWCSQLTTLKLDALNISSVTDMSHMFDDCIHLATLDMSGLDTSNVTNMSGMFSGCRQLAALEMRGWDFSSVSTMENMFYGCENLVTLGLNDVKTSNMTTMDYMFSGCSGLKNLNLSSFDTSNVTSMKSMFSNCSGLTDLDLSMFDTLKVTSTDSMFSGCSGLTKLDLSTFNTSNVTSMTSMFSGCTGLTNLDLSTFNTSNVTSMTSMFSGCTGLTNLDLSTFNTSNVTSMAYMFSGCAGLTDLDLSAFDTLNVTTMDSMFSGCESLTELVLSTFDTSNVTSMYSMFSGCSGLTAVDLSGFNTSLVSNRNDVFAGCTRLQVLITPGTSGVSIELPKVMFDREGKAYKVLPLLGRSIVLANPQQLAIDIACPESVILDQELITVQRGGTLKLEVSVFPEKFYVNKEVRWSSSDESVATVDAYGRVSALKVGKADISVTAEEGGASAVCSLTVTAPNATGITIDKESASINVGKILQITAAIEPSDANQNISWSSSDDSVVAVNQSGVVTALKEGSAVVTATSVDGGFTAVCNITVKKNVTFTDVNDPSAWYYDSVYWAVENGVTSGMGEGTFQPMAKLSRAQSVTFLYNLAGRPDVSGLEAKEFSDVPKSAWYYNAVKWAVANKITSGYGTGTFQPNATCNRAMIVTFLKNYAKAAGTYKAPTTAANFKDVAKNAWYKESVDWAVENGITSGYGKGTFSPNVTCNRAMMVTFLKKVAELPMAG